MANKVALSKLNASTVDILNTIRANASYQYQNLVPEIGQATEIPKIGEILFGYPALANEFISTLVNRIALTVIRSANFNNPLAELKKGYLGYGETIQEAFVSMTKARAFSVEKAASREFKRTLPDVKTAFHVMNYKVQYPITIQHEELQRAFLSEEGVVDLIEKIKASVVTASEYDEYLLMKYLLIRGISHGKLYPVLVGDIEDAAEKFRGMANILPFPRKEYNEMHVLNNTPKEDLHIFMDAAYNAKFDTGLLADKFHMEKAEFMGKLHIIDDWTTFDNERFSDIMSESDGFEPITDDELALMQNVKAVLASSEWFQIYDNLMEFTEVNVTTGLYWNFNLHIWKTLARSPFSEAIVFCGDEVDPALPDNITVSVDSVEAYQNGYILTMSFDDDNPGLAPTTPRLIQTEEATTAGLAVIPAGGMIIPTAVTALSGDYVQAELGGAIYTLGSSVTVADIKAGDTLTLEKD